MATKKKSSGKKRPGLYANIHAKRKRIKAGSGEKMRKKEQKELQLINNLKELQKQLKRGKNV